MTAYDERLVPILYRGPGERIGLSEKAAQTVAAAHAEAQRALEEAAKAVHAAGSDPDSERYAAAREAQAEVVAKHLLIGEAVVIHNKDDTRGDYTPASIGGSDLQEALTEAIGGFDIHHIGEPNESSDHIFTPDWVASTHKQLAELLADYYSCDVRPLSEVL